MGKLIPAPVLNSLPASNRAIITGKHFFPNLISGPFMHGLKIAFTASLAMFVLAALASWLAGGKYVYEEARDEHILADRTRAEEQLVGAD
jgi:hypothetical protein